MENSTTLGPLTSGRVRSQFFSLFDRSFPLETVWIEGKKIYECRDGIMQTTLTYKQHMERNFYQEGDIILLGCQPRHVLESIFPELARNEPQGDVYLDLVVFLVLGALPPEYHYGWKIENISPHPSGEGRGTILLRGVLILPDKGYIELKQTLSASKEALGVRMINARISMGLKWFADLTVTLVQVSVKALPYAIYGGSALEVAKRLAGRSFARHLLRHVLKKILTKALAKALRASVEEATLVIIRETQRTDLLLQTGAQIKNPQWNDVIAKGVEAGMDSFLKELIKEMMISPEFIDVGMVTNTIKQTFLKEVKKVLTSFFLEEVANMNTFILSTCIKGSGENPDLFLKNMGEKASSHLKKTIEKEFEALIKHLGEAGT